jgi:hypothetical protein
MRLDWVGRILTLLPKMAAGRCLNPQAKTPAPRSRPGRGFTGLPSPVLLPAAFTFGSSVKMRPTGWQPFQKVCAAEKFFVPVRFGRRPQFE